MIKVNPEEINQDDPLDIGLDVYELMKFKGSNPGNMYEPETTCKKG